MEENGHKQLDRDGRPGVTSPESPSGDHVPGVLISEEMLFKMRR